MKFSTSPLKPLNRIQWNLTGSNNSTSSAKFLFFGPIGKPRLPPRALICWDIFDFSSNRLTNFAKTWQEARTQCPLLSFCFSGRSKKKTKQDGLLGLSFAETFSTFSLQSQNGIWRNLSGSQDATPSNKFVFFGPIRKTRWPPRPLKGWDIFDFFSETAEQNFPKPDRKQELNVLKVHQVFVLGPIGKTWWPPGLWLADALSISSLKPLNEICQTSTGRIQRHLPTLCFSDRSEKQMSALASDWRKHFRILLWTDFGKTWQKVSIKRPLSSVCGCVFGPSHQQRWPPWLRHFQLLCNRWTDFDETSQKAIPLSSSFSCRPNKKDGRPGLLLANLFSSPEPKAQVHFCINFWNHAISVVRCLSVRR